MKLSDKQLFIVKYLLEKKEATKSEMVEDLKVMYWYYCNYDKHFGEILSRMVKQGLLARVKKGTYKLIRTEKYNSIENENQLNLNF